jgi:hypothetical protein
VEERASFVERTGADAAPWELRHDGGDRPLRSVRRGAQCLDGVLELACVSGPRGATESSEKRGWQGAQIAAQTLIEAL